MSAPNMAAWFQYQMSSRGRKCTGVLGTGMYAGQNCHLADRDPAGRVVLYCLMCRVPFMYIPTMG
ncbi:uncharacterized protein EHS24_002060 [Apiotrichum porosum]|uniref:Uncharacterized protein n=1 Tax=Apiotrichum porosum TaxID=105984 RepID=A0A427XHG5_9TREE|nr:uncharacterized protein EHS24_002060 [Apiotrichum porosum]RSH78340.1 hypothetical protein EHS24_002060 [Apiotrichum porosum]